MKALKGILMTLTATLVLGLLASCKSADTGAADEWTPVASYGELEGTYNGTTSIRPPNYDKLSEFNEAFREVSIAVAMSLACPAAEGEPVQMTEIHEFTQYVDTMGDFLMGDPGVQATVQAQGVSPADYFWSLLQAADPSSQYTAGSPYIRTSFRESPVQEMDASLAAGMVTLYRNRDGSKLRMTVYTPHADTGLPSDEVAMEMVLERVNPYNSVIKLD